MDKKVQVRAWRTSFIFIITALLFSCADNNATSPIVVAEAQSNHYVALRLEDRPGALDLNSDDYLITDLSGESLAIEQAVLSEDGAQVILTTASQNDVVYAIGKTSDQVARRSLIEGVIPLAYAQSDSSTVHFNGSLAPEPALLSAISLSNTSVLLTFSAEMSSVAETIEYYRITAADDNGPSVDVGDVSIVEAERLPDRSLVLLTTTDQANIEYQVKAVNITSAKNKKRIDPTNNVRPFFGIAPLDTDAPLLTDLDSTGPTTMVLTFSEPLGESAGDASYYTVYSCAVAQMPCLPENQIELTVTGAELSQYNTQVVLSTLPQEVGVIYTVVVSDLIEDSRGNPLDVSTATASVTYNGESDSESALALPQLLSATALSNTQVMVSFSKAMSMSVEYPLNYSIVQSSVNTEAGTLGVIMAEYMSDDRSVVLLTTRSQNELNYQLTVTNVRDTYGQSIDASITNGGFITANTTVFRGLPVDSTSAVDTDGDGLTDNEEQLGYQVVYFNINGDTVREQVTSSPDLYDTDGDGISDGDEKHYGSHPRDADTDNDGLTDYQELNEIYSDPFKQDSDGDGLTDGLEFNFFRTSPLFADTDGDQIEDFDEIITNRNPRISDMPQLDIEVGDVNLLLDYRFDVTKEGSTTQGDTKTVSTTMAQSESSEYSKSDSSSHSFDIKLGFEQELNVELVVPEYSFKFSQEVSTSHSWTSSVSRTSAQATSKEYAKSLESNVEVVKGETVSRVIEGARMSVPLYIKAGNDIAFEISNIIVTALVPSPDNPQNFVPVATLVAATNGDVPFTLGPLLPERGPLEFVADTIFPSVVEELMQNPRGIIFKVANYNIVDELGRDFAFSSQEIAERTAPLVFDHGGMDLDNDGQTDYPERYRVAINYGFDVDTDHRRIFDDYGKMLGAAFDNILEEVLGLTHYDEAVTPTNSLNADELYNSYSTLHCDYGQILYRVRSTEAITGPDGLCQIKKGWGVMQPDGSVKPRGDLFPEELVMNANRGVRLAYYADEDGDGLPNRAEYIYGCSASNMDTDDDSLDDRFEVLGVRRDDNGVAINADGSVLPRENIWMVELQNGNQYEARSRCDTADSDYDGLLDIEEYNRVIYERNLLTGELVLDINNQPTVVYDFTHLLTNDDPIPDPFIGGRTDPLNQDTDGDGVSDYDEVAGYIAELKFALDTSESSCVIPVGGDAYYVECRTNPLAADTDGDTLNDGDEIRLGGDPTVKDNTDVGDLDYDGVTNREENEGVLVTWEGVSLQVGQPGDIFSGTFMSTVTLADTDADGLSDYEEYFRVPPTNPTVIDTDEDGISDYQEVMGIPVGENDQFIFTEATDADSDNDGLSDGDELKGWEVRVAGEAAINVYASNPLVADSDLDGLMDVEEKAKKTNPNEPNTDGDVYGLSDEDEVLLGTDPLNPQDMCVRFTYTSTMVADDGGDVDDSGKVSGDFNMDLTTLDANGQPQQEKWVISQNIDGGWFTTGVEKAQNHSAVRLMKYGSFASAWHNNPYYYWGAHWVKLNIQEVTLDFSAFSAEQPMQTIKIHSTGGSSIDLVSTLTANVLTASEINKANLDAFCRSKVAVPDVVNTDKEVAVVALREASFRIGVINKIQNSEPAGTVLTQTPDAGTLAATESTVDLLVSAGSITVPDLAGMTRTEAQVAIEDLGLNFQIDAEIEDDNVSVAEVSIQTPAAGATVVDQSTIYVTLLVPSDGVTVMPFLIGLARDVAEELLIENSLQLGNVDGSSDSNAVVSVQSEAPGVQLNDGTEIDITMESK